ncbi:MAG: RNA 2',3'-cyclic phosphodiesterase [candidate division WOR-3 bacterium]
MRAFVAVEISDRVRDQIRLLLESLKVDPSARVSSVRWVRPEQMHLTLAFLGEVSLDFIESAKQRLAAVSSDQASFVCKLKGLGAFPSLGRARVVWTGVEEGNEQLKQLYGAVVRELAKVGYEPEKRPFSPHLTLGRLKIPADVRQMCETRFESERFGIDRLVLFQSILRPVGAEYVKLADWGLGEKTPIS